MTAPPMIHPEAAKNLALAVIVCSEGPVLLLDGDRKVISASNSFCRAFGLDPADIDARPLGEIGGGEWAAPQLDTLLRIAISGGAQIERYEMDLKQRTGLPRRLVLNARKLDYGGDADHVRILLSVADVTDMRLAEKIKDDLLQEKGILLKELQHRVANSLQIIASVLMQSARQVQSEETRLHLHDAHNRVMSVATLQQHLAQSSVGEVELHAYFEDLCRSIGASMIRDHNQVTIEVSADKSKVGGDVSVSLGLIVTELVINALKHAFPGHQSGKILVGYQSSGADWTLSVGDNGVGMPAPREGSNAGLGTSIVDALARQLKAKVVVADAEPGTTISIVHEDAPRHGTAEPV